MRDLGRLTIPAYAMACALICIPALELLMALRPFSVGQAAWRVGAVGLFSRSLLTPLLGLLLIGAAGVLGGRHGVVRLFSLASAGAALFILACLGSYMIDGLDVRDLMTPAQQQQFDPTAVSTVIKLGLIELVALTFAVVGWRIASEKGGGSGRGDRSTPGIVAAGARSGSRRSEPEVPATASAEVSDEAPTQG